MPSFNVVVKAAGALLLFPREAQAFSVDMASSMGGTEQQTQELAPISQSTLDSTATLFMNPGTELEESAPYTFQMLRQMQSPAFLTSESGSALPGESVAPKERNFDNDLSGLVPKRPTASVVSKGRSFDNDLAGLVPKRPKASLVSEAEVLEKPRHGRHAAFEERHTTRKSRIDRERSTSSEHLVSVSSDAAITSGATASLDEVGYQAVAARRDSREMWFFIRRAVEAKGAEVLDEGMFNGLVPYYSGEKDVQSFDRLSEELFNNGVSKGMISKTRPHSMSRSMDEDFEEVYQRTHGLS